MASPQPDSYVAPSGAALWAGRFHPLKPLNASAQAAARAAGSASTAVQMQAAATAAALAAAAAAHGVPLAGAASGQGGAAATLTVGSGGGSVTVLWDAAPGATGYVLYYGTATRLYDQAKGAGIAVGNVTSYTLTGLTPGVTYYVAPAAVDGSGNESDVSQEISKVAA